MRFWRHRDEIEGRLRSARPDARPEFVRALADRVAPRTVATRRSLAFAVVFAAVLVSMFAAAGGIGYAADAVSSTVSSATSKLTGASSNGTTGTTGGGYGGGGGCYSPGCDQYAKTAKIIIKKVTIPSTDYTTDFKFTGHPSATLENGESQSETVVAPGTYTSTELVPDGWKLKSIVCDPHGTGNVGTATATFNVQPNDVIKCTFTNEKKAKIKVWKKTVPAGAYDKFTFSGDLAGQIRTASTSTSTSTRAPTTPPRRRRTAGS